MGTNSITLITIVVILFFCTLPIVIINQKRKSKMKKALQLFYSFAGENQCTVSEYELFNKLIIGIDKNARQLFFFRTTEGHELKQKIDLNQIKKCRMEEIARTIDTTHVIERVDLIFSPVATGQKESTVNVYNLDFDYVTLTGEIQFAEKWVRIINDYLKTSTNK